MALATAGYLAAYTVFLDHAPWRRRLVSTAARTALVLAAWAAIYKLGHFGVAGSGFYHRSRAPRRWPSLALLADRALYLLLGQWTPIAADLGSVLPEAEACCGATTADWSRS